VFSSQAGPALINTEYTSINKWEYRMKSAPMQNQKTFALIASTMCLQLLLFSACAPAQDNLKRVTTLLGEAVTELAAKRYEAAASKAEEAAKLAEDSGRVQQRAGEILFLAGKPVESLPMFDRANALVPDEAPHNWQRGIALGIAGKWAEGAAQFKQHHDVNPDDVENSAWYYLCVAKAENLEAAKKSVIPSRGDGRQPMMSILQMLKGEKQPDEVIAAAIANTPEGSRRESALFYADLYIAMFYDAEGNTEETKKYLASSLERGSSGYMVDTARVYLEHRFPKPSK
jgi:lipoprotein NlpI